MRTERLKDLDLVLTVGCVVGLVIVSYFLARDADRQRDDREVALAAGTVTHAAQPIRRRPARTLGWDSLALGDAAFTRDTIFVPPGTDAVITLQDGTELTLEENSLLVLEAGGKDTPHHLSLERGAMTSAPKNAGVHLDVSGKTAELAPGSVVRVDADKRIDVLDGAVMVGANTINPGLGGTMGDMQSFREWPATPVSPAPGARVYLHDDHATVTLRVRTQAANLRIEIGDDKAIALAGDAHTFAATKPGIYHWRLVDNDGHAASTTSYFVVTTNSPPLPLVPSDHENVVARRASDPLFFAWTAVDGAARYRVEIDGAQTVKTQDTRVAIRDLPEGAYTWRVIAERDGGPESPVSAPRRFRLSRKPLPTAPELLDPEVELKRK